MGANEIRKLFGTCISEHTAAWSDVRFERQSTLACELYRLKQQFTLQKGRQQGQGCQQSAAP